MSLQAYYRPETRRRMETVVVYDEHEAFLLRSALMFYGLDGWEEYWSFFDMPRWLKPRYWHPTIEEIVFRGTWR